MKNMFLYGLLCVLVLNWGCVDEDGSPETVLPVVDLVAGELTEGDTTQNLIFTVTLSAPTEAQVVVSFGTIAGTAQSGVDYVGVTESELIIPPGATSQTVEIIVVDDNIIEGDETLEAVIFAPVNAQLGVARAEAIILNDDVPTPEPTGPPSEGYDSPTSYPGYTMLWQDEFNDGVLNDTYWTHEVGNGNNGWGNNELQYYQADNTTFHPEGYLVIEAREQAQGGFNYTSSRLKTQNKFNFTYGRVDIRAALPKGQGIWPALWMLGERITSVSWPACGEIDIMEIVGHDPARLHGTAHWAQSGHALYGQSTTLAEGDFSDEFHVFSIIWDDTQIRWLLDDVEYNTLDITPPELSEFHENFFLLMNVAVGGNWPGSPDATTNFPQRMYVDYVRVFQQ